MSTQSWSLDTCDCVLEEAVDYDYAPPIKYALLPIRVCQAHLSFYTSDASREELYSQVSSENRKKNIAVTALLQALPDSDKVAVRDKNGQVIGQAFIEDPIWSFDEKRELILNHPALADEAIAITVKQSLELE